MSIHWWNYLTLRHLRVYPPLFSFRIHKALDYLLVCSLVGSFCLLHTHFLILLAISLLPFAQSIPPSLSCSFLNSMETRNTVKLKCETLSHKWFRMSRTQDVIVSTASLACPFAFSLDHWLICLLRTASFDRMLCCTLSFAHELTLS